MYFFKLIFLLFLTHYSYSSEQLSSTDRNTVNTPHRGRYFNFSVGLGKPSDTDFSVTDIAHEASFLSPLMIGIGKNAGNFSAEINFFRSSDSIKEDLPFVSGGSFITTGLVANLYFHYNFNQRASFYYGFGLGLVRYKLSSDVVPDVAVNELSALIQAVIGFDYILNEKVSLFSDLRYLDSNEPELRYSRVFADYYDYRNTTLNFGVRIYY